ncbi:ATP-dependent protease La [Polychaeton citri CBS 116435]|uniref:Lon protease homolog 2, peroxisomal n=1 Tax=Polychaeton citri CBS 116435 TaxID=1314669 RepID=A0A9P4Q648_9PEZI|nr:ATP-dependent protease La [Polychaeton citri CBS 116435]
MGVSKSSALPLVPLPVNSVVYPGTTTRIPLQNRSDVAAILAHTYSLSSTPRPEANTVLVGCVPLNSKYLSQDGKRLITESDYGVGNDEKQRSTPAELDVSQARKPDLFMYGTTARVTGVQGRRPGELMLVVEGLQRFRIEKIIKEKPYFEAKVCMLQDVALDEKDVQNVQLFAQMKQLSREMVALVRLSALLPRSVAGTSGMSLSPILARRIELYIARKNIEDAGVLADFLANLIDGSLEDELLVLCAMDVKERLERVIEMLQKQIATMHLNGRQLATVVPAADGQRMPSQALDIEMLNRIRQRLDKPGGVGMGMPGGMGRAGGIGGHEDEENEVEELKKKLEEAKLSPEAKKIADRELKRLAKMNPAQAEHQVIRNYLENLSEIPWTKVTEDHLDASTMQKAKKQLDDDHYGLDKVKKRLLEYLAVLKLKQAVNLDLEKQIKAISEVADASKEPAKREIAKRQQNQGPEEIRLLKSKKMVDKSPILLLVGPPGVGKTSLAKSIATSLGREFHRISLGGVRDEAEIRGHRRTYVAAMPGLIVNGLKKVGVANPVLLLDEIDKVGQASHNGDPSAAMLEVLDPEQNHNFTDHYVNIPIDLSKVLFIATANTLDTIPPPLLDRMETIQLSGYTTLEKRAIATRHLLPKQVLTNGLKYQDVSVLENVVDKVITAYTREAGVRNLERELGSVCRAKAVQYSEAKDTSTLQAYSPTVSLTDLEDMLGMEKFEEELAATSSQPGVVTGLVAYSSGTQGSILFIEVASMPSNGAGRVQLTGKLGDVLKESVEVALTWVKSHAYALSLTTSPDADIMHNRSIHVHCPSGAIPKDGPSAGLAHTIALISLFSGRPVPPSIAMTGETSLRGKVLPVGGIKEKVLGAMRAGVRKVILPESNRKDARELPDEVKEGMEIVFVSSVAEAIPVVFEGWETGDSWAAVESRL